MKSEFWIWNNYVESKKQCVLNHRPAAMGGVRMDDGKPVSPSIFSTSPLLFDIQKKEEGILTDNLVATGFPGLIVSAAMRNVLDKCERVNIQYFPVTLQDEKQKTISSDYFLANVTSRFECIDVDASEMELDEENPGEVISIDKLVLDESKISADIFRLAELPILVIVTTSVKKAIEEARLTGVRFQSLGDFFF